jgi:hypothetical protein
MKHGEPKEEVFKILNRSLINLDCLWAQAGMSYTQKINGLLSHAAEQVQRLGGIEVKQVESHSKIEVKLNNKEIRALTTKVKIKSKQEFKNRMVDSFTKGFQAKMERDNS